MSPSTRTSVSRSFFLFLLALLLSAASGHGQQVRINEVMASNSTTIADEDGDFQDWIELHNAGAISINLNGWGLSDDTAEPYKWVLPDLAIEPGQFLLIWASGKDRKLGAVLHTNFAIGASGEEVTLHDAGGVKVDEVEPVAMAADTSYGRSRDNPDTWVFFAQTTPGAVNAGPSGHLLAESVLFSETSRTFSSGFSLALSGAEEDQEIRYTLNGSFPSAGSSLYTSPLQVSGTTMVRARLVAPSGAVGPVTSHHFLRLDANVAGRKSNLPMVVLDAGGQNLDGTTKRPAFFHLFDRDAEGISALERQPALATRQGLRWRGSSSQSHPKKPYAVEFWDESDDDLSHEILGMAADSDWVFYAPYNYDRAFIRNSVAYELSRRIGRWASDTRFVEVFVNHDGGHLSASDYMGVYAIFEQIKHGDHRLGHDNVESEDIPPEGPIDVTAAGPWTGGYIFKVDRADDDEFTWRTENGIPGTMPTIDMVLNRPKLTKLDGGPYADSGAAIGSSRQLTYIRGYIQTFEDALFADRAGGFASRDHLDFIDRSSWVDHLLINAFTKNVDALRLSAFFHKPQNQPIVAGPVWDFDRSMDSYDGRDDDWNIWYGGGDSTSYFEIDWWGVLAEDPDFLQAFYDRWAEVRESDFSDPSLAQLTQAMGNEIDNAAHGLGSAAARDAARWNANTPLGGIYQNEIQHVRTWMLNRAGWMDRRRVDGGLLPIPPIIQAEEGSATIESEDARRESIYFTTDGSDPRADGGTPAGQLYTGPISINGPTTLTGRALDGDGNWSTPSVALLSAPDPSGGGALLHYWSFNTTTLAPFFTLGGASLTVAPGASTEVVFDTDADFSATNSRFDEEAGAHLRVNNPLGAAVNLALPTSGYKEIVLRYEARRSGQGAGLQQLSYTVDGVVYTDWPQTVAVVDDVPQLYVFDFSEIAGTSDNADFAVRIGFAQGDGGIAGNDRFDNITLEGAPLEGVNQPPHVAEVPGLVEIYAGGPAGTLDLDQVFEDADGDTLTFAATSAQPALLAASIDGSSLGLQAMGQGETTVSIEANDGVNPPVGLSFRVLVYPAPFPIGTADFFFGEWSPNEPAGSFPPNMLFLQSALDDPDLAEPLLFAYQIPEEDAASASDVDFPYAATSRSRISGHDISGISFINTGRGRDLGAALVALDTRQAADIDVTWTAGTVVANNRVYGIRLQSRVGLAEPWSDVLAGGEPVEYLRHETPGQTILGPVRLSASLEGHANLQLRWKYHHISGTSGPRAQLRLDDIVISAVERDSYEVWQARVFPDPADRENPEISGPLADPQNEGVPNLLRYALEIEPGEAGRALLPQAEVEAGRLSLLFRRSAAKSDIGYLVEVSPDLTDWSEVLYDSRVDPSENTDGEWMRVSDSMPLSEVEGSRFLRLGIAEE